MYFFFLYFVLDYVFNLLFMLFGFGILVENKIKLKRKKEKFVEEVFF